MKILYYLNQRAVLMKTRVPLRRARSLVYEVYFVFTL